VLKVTVASPSAEEVPDDDGDAPMEQQAQEDAALRVQDRLSKRAKENPTEEPKRAVSQQKKRAATTSASQPMNRSRND
jgi:hypothetical protein